MRRRAKGVFAKRMLSDNGVREADVARREATQDMSTAQRDVRLVLRENPPSRLANRRGFFGGQSGEVVWDASISFGFLGVCSFSGVSVGLKKSEPLLRLRCSSANRLFTPACSARLSFF